MLSTILRTLFFYFFITFAYRLMGKREVGQLGVIDLIVSILIAELVAISIENYNENIFLTIIPISILVILEIVFGFINLKSRKFSKIFSGKPTLIISSGKLLYNNLISQRYSLDDLLLELRQKGIYSIEDVEYAFLEPNGKLSIFKYNPIRIKKPMPLPIIIEGQIQEEVLKEIKKDKKWLLDILDYNNIKLDEIFYCLYKNTHIYIIRRDQ